MGPIRSNRFGKKVGGGLYLGLAISAFVASLASPALAGLSTTANDFIAPGTQPLTLTDPVASPSSCTGCHSNYGSPEKEPWRVWQGSMVAQAGRDPLTWAAMAVSNQDAPNSGETCIRCHMPKGWLSGHSAAPDGSLITADDRQGVQCASCHRMVDPQNAAGSPAGDAAIVAAISPPVTVVGAGQMIIDPTDTVRGPFDIPADLGFDPHGPPSRTALQASFQSSSRMCGTCHDVRNTVFQRNMLGQYELSTMDAPADPALGFPEQATYSEWEFSAYNGAGIYAPQFAGDGNGVDGDYTVGSCQSCHMPRVTGKAASSGLTRTNMPVHELVGANTFVPTIIPMHPVFGAEVDAGILAEGVARAQRMLQRSATVTAGLEAGTGTLSVRVTNESGHKLPTGYPEGRRMWLNVRAYDADDNLVFESGKYDDTDADIVGYQAAPMDPDYDANLKVWETHQGMSADVAAATGNVSGPSFHLSLNNVREFDNRIPPRGFTNAAYQAVDAQPVGATYADGQYWDDATYPVGTDAVRAEVALYYQTTNKHLIEFLRDENVTTTDGTILHDLWEDAGKGGPVEVAYGVALADAKKIQGCRQNIDKVEAKYLKTYKKQWAKCFAATAAGDSCDATTRDAEIAEAAATLRARLGGADDKKCAGMTPITTGLGSYCPAPCATILLATMDDVADCSICLAENVIDDALESAYGTVPPAVPAAVPAGAPASCQKQLGSAATTLAQKWSSALASCEKDNASGKNSPAVDCATDPKGKIGKAKDSAAKKVDKCLNDAGIEGCALSTGDNAALSQCIEDALEDGVTAYPTIAYP